MIPELGHLALILALGCVILTIAMPMISVRRLVLQRQRYYLGAELLMIVIAYACLTYSFLTDDFSVLYVAQHSSRELPLLYKSFAVWGAHEGSMMLWTLILGVWTVAVAYCSKSLPRLLLRRILMILSILSLGFLLFILATSNPFLRLLPHFPKQGLDLNPLLQDPGFVIHPPMLYGGYVGFAVTFAFAIAALWSGRLDARWAAWSRPWTAIAWCFLTAGITLGSWWAYRVLGWGGWWFWDPVENASFMPWLVGTALLHSLIVTQKRETFRAWTVLLAIATFSLSLLGTFLVRSGVLTSVHAFAVDPKRGIYMLGFLAVVISGSLTLYAWRAPQLRQGEKFSLLSRESFLLLNNIFLAVAMLTVLLGTLYPLLIDALGLGKLSVGAPYFNWVFIPLMVPVIILMGIAPHVFWKSMEAPALKSRFLVIAGLMLVTAIFLIPIWLAPGSVPFGLGILLAFWLIWTTVVDIVRKFPRVRDHMGMWCAHLGIAAAALGIAVVTHYGDQIDVRLAVGESANIAGYDIQLKTLRDLKGPNYQGASADFQITRGEVPVTTLTAEKRHYEKQTMSLANAAITSTIWRDIYIAMGEPLTADAWSVRVYYKPMVRWIWAGGFMILLGGLLSLRRRR